MRVHVEAAGVLAPGLPDWPAACAVLAGRQRYAPAPLQPPRIDLLPPTERRRTGLPVKLAIAAGQQAVVAADADAKELSTIFCSSGGDGEVLHEICSALATPEREISPTRFHNSVQNAPAGYWGIATRSLAPSTSVCCFDWSCAAGLVEACAQLAVDQDRALLVCFDAPYPGPLARARPIAAPFACSLLLAREKGARAFACLQVRATHGETASRLSDPALEGLRLGNPAAGALPLLAALAVLQPARVVLDQVGGRQLGIDVTPC
jgi:hypothetical protein